MGQNAGFRFCARSGTEQFNSPIASAGYTCSDSYPTRPRRPGGSSPWALALATPPRAVDRATSLVCHRRGRVRVAVFGQTGVLEGDELVEVRGALGVAERLEQVERAEGPAAGQVHLAVDETR